MGGAPDAQLSVPAMAGGGEKKLLIGDLSRLLLTAEHMPDLEKGIKEEGMDPHHAVKVPAVAEDEDEEHERVILKHLRYHQQVEGGAVAGNKMNPGQKWRPYYWLLVAAASSVILLNNHIHAAPKDQVFVAPELAMVAVLLSSIWLIFLSVKQMM